MAHSGDMSTYTAVFRLQTADAHRRVTKRNRQPVSCTACRSRKLKCDRQQPCGACVRRGDGDGCRVAPAGASGSGSSSGSSSSTIAAAAAAAAGGGAGAATAPRHEVQARLQRLEEMVNGLVTLSHPGHGEPSPPPSHGPTSAASSTASSTHPSMSTVEVSPESASSTGGHLTRDGAEVSFAGATHWAAVLESIHDIQGYLEAEDEPDGLPRLAQRQDQATGAPDLVLGAEPITIGEVQAVLPPRAECDRLLTFYFQAGYMRSPVIHAHQFQRTYEAFWERPEAASLLWVSILLSVLAATVQLQEGRGAPCGTPVRSRRAAELSLAATRCLVAGEYLRARPHAVEALVMLCQSAMLQRRDSDPMLWSKWGVAVRLAQRMGYHRDPARLRGRVSAFEAEMRRRTWYVCETFDVLYSFQLGMPSVVHDDEADAGPPTNLLDEDFDEGSPALPPERPLTEMTPMLYCCCKSRMVRLLRRVIRHALATRPPAYAETCRLNDALIRQHDEVPPPLRVRPIRACSFTDSATDIMRRLMMELVYLKCLCVLHRRYLTVERDNPKYDQSRRICREAALRTMELHAEFDDESRPGGRMAEDQHLLTTLSMHDFLMAAMILCVDLMERGSSVDPEERKKKIGLLQDARRSWTQRECLSQDSRHAARVLAVMISKLTDQGREEERRNSEAEAEAAAAAATAAANGAAAAAAVAQATQGYSETWDFWPDNAQAMPLDDFIGQEDLDWNAIDSYILGRQDVDMPAAPPVLAAAAADDPRSGWPMLNYDLVDVNARSWDTGGI